MATYNSRMSNVSEILAQHYLGNSVQSWLTAVLAFLVTFIVLPLLRSLIMGRRARWMGARPPAGVQLVLTLIARTSRMFLWAVAVYVGERFLDFPARLERISTIVVVLVFWLQFAFWASAAVQFALDQQRLRAEATGDTSLKGSLDVLLFTARLIIYVIAMLLALDNLGVNITTLVAGLGVGGIAIALAVQNVLGDLFASMSITLDKPFLVGDWLRVDDCEGVVECIGIKSTRLRSVSGEQIILANADLLKSRVHNLGRMPERRSLFTLGVAYQTTPAKLQEAADLVRSCIEGVPGTRFEYCLFRSFGDSALNLQTCYFVPDPTARGFAAIEDAVNRKIHAAFAAAGIEFAYPTRTVHVRGVSS